MHQAGLFNKIGEENTVANLDDALKRARVLLPSKKSAKSAKNK
jgi:hypothetical protein